MLTIKPARAFGVLLGLAILCLVPATLPAQGLIWSLPEKEGTWIRYEGTYQQIEYRPKNRGNAKDLPISKRTFTWNRNLTIKSLVTPAEQRTAKFHGRDVTCRWIELKVETGKASRESEGRLDPGPGGTRLYKVLIPESQIFGTLVNNRSVDTIGIPVAFLPIIRGYRKIGNRKEEEIKTKVLQIYPSISLLKHYRELKPETDQPEDPGLGEDLGAINAIKLIGTAQVQSRIGKSEHEAAIWRSQDIPFGLARWSVKITRSRKRFTEPRTSFGNGLRTETKVEMKAVEIGTDAKSELAVQ
ncbi:MAG: hypothetical protein VB859_05130 [Planctomycetaceae bacterium]